MGVEVKLEVKKIDGSGTGEQVTLKPEIFEIEPNKHVLWMAIVAELANRRQGTSKTKTRTEVRGGGKKPWRQKGRGTARAGSSRSPVWVGGGRVFGPEPRQYTKKMTKKMRSLARRSALALKAQNAKILVVDDFNFEAPKTQEMTRILDALSLDATKTLLLTPENNSNMWLSGRNIPKLSVREAQVFSTYDVVKADTLLIQKSALAKISEVL